MRSAFHRLDDEYDSPTEAREALYGELTGEVGGPNEYNDGRALSDLEDTGQNARDR